jgi:hypothetical protein
MSAIDSGNDMVTVGQKQWTMRKQADSASDMKEKPTIPNEKKAYRYLWLKKGSFPLWHQFAGFSPFSFVSPCFNVVQYWVPDSGPDFQWG